MMCPLKPLAAASIICMSAIYSLSACTTARFDREEFEACATTDQQLGEFRDSLMRISHRFGLTFVDDSAHQMRLRSEHNQADRDIGPPRLLYISAFRADGMRVDVTNQGLAERQLLLGFSAGANVEESLELRRSVLESLQGATYLRSVPQGSGALRSSDCR